MDVYLIVFFDFTKVYTIASGVTGCEELIQS